MELETLGQTMKRLALESGWSALRIARAMNVTPKTIYRWWGDEQAPSAPHLQQYARAIGREVGELFGESVSERLLRIFQTVVDGLMAGQSMGAVLERTLGEGSVTDAERAELDSLSADLREWFRKRAGRDWDTLSDAEKRAIAIETREDARRSGQG